jgi:hypothetical protein
MERTDRTIGPAPEPRERRRVIGWSPGTVAVLAAGAFLVALGLLEFFTGARLSNLTAPSGNGLAVRQSGVLALIEIGFGIAVVWIAGDFPWYGRGAAIGLGVIAIGFGIALLGWSSSLSRVFGGDPASGWLFVAVGAIAAASAFVPRRRVGASAAMTADLETPEAPAKPIRRVS